MQRQDSMQEAQQQLDKAEAAAQEGRVDGTCVSFDEAPGYLRREFIMSGYYIGAGWWGSGKGMRHLPCAMLHML